MRDNPKVFISHASDDKERFVIGFAKKLRSIGIDAWVDKWEMLPGDSLVDKIFEEGIKSAECFIIVLSKYSINKPWVREELNAAFVKRVSEHIKIIPVVLDGVSVPECLSSTLYESIKDTESYDDSFTRIKNSILGISEKPPIGALPAYLSFDGFSVPGLTKIDEEVLLAACEFAIEKNDVVMIPSKALYSRIKNLNIEQSEFKESMIILNQRGYFTGSRAMDNSYPFFNIQYNTMLLYAEKMYPNFTDIRRKVALGILNDTGNMKIANDLSIPRILVDCIFDDLNNKGYIKCQKLMSGQYRVTEKSPELRRMLNGEC